MISPFIERTSSMTISSDPIRKAQDLLTRQSTLLNTLEKKELAIETRMSTLFRDAPPLPEKDFTHKLRHFKKIRLDRTATEQELCTINQLLESALKNVATTSSLSLESKQNLIHRIKKQYQKAVSRERKVNLTPSATSLERAHAFRKKILARKNAAHLHLEPSVWRRIANFFSAS